MTRTGICGWLLVACATLTPLPSVEAQAGPSFGGDLVEITEPVLEGLVRGLRAEIALQKEFRDLLAKYPTQEQYNACGAQVATSEEAMKLLELMNLPENATPEQSQRAMQKFTTETAALHKRKCPFDPNEWNSSTKAKRLKEIEAKAAEAAGSSSPAGVYPLLKERIVA
ncbi:MAG TPA: hypothetical protein VJ808_12265, partial [Gemmatimonadales bacterium]|nr:hypothetical protein [Gemmatimonadales bacterium]